MMSIKWLFLTMLLVSCTSFQPKIITKEVKVPVSVPCVEKVPPKSELLSNSLELTDSIHDKVKALLLDNNALNADNLELRALLSGCVIHSQE